MNSLQLYGLAAARVLVGVVSLATVLALSRRLPPKKL